MSSPEEPPGLPTPTSNENSRKHNRPDDDEQPQKVQRRRIACQRCRGRKVKCDNVRPSCGSCVESGKQCVYVDGGREKSPEASIPAQLMSRLDQILAGVQGITASLRPQDSIHEHRIQDPVSGSPGISEISNITPNFQQPATIDDAQKDYLRIPSTNTTADTILTWPIYAGEYPPGYLIEAILGKGEDDKSDAFVVRHGEFESLSDERIPSLIDRFLRNVHTKNPILDVDALIQYGQTAAANGPGWDAQSCLVLLACALGSISYSFETSIANQTEMVAGSAPTSASTYKKELRQGESCYALACRRLGLLKHTILGAQCYFYSAVYLMYTFAPLQAWNHFCQASTFYQLSFRKISKVSETPRLDGLSLTHRRLEQSLYWSCFKSECEIRVELPLPQSGIASIEYPHLFPSPPSHSRNSTGRTLHGSEILSADPGLMHDSDKDLNEEKSWYYYLTEVALRRISNRILSTFYRQDHTNWTNILPLIPIAKEFESQILVWSANLPPAMQYDVNLTTEEGPSRELSWATGNRLLEMRSWLYQPFLYHAIHADSQTDHVRENPVLQSLVEAAMDCHLETVQKRCFRHRHHGIWFDIRAVVTAAFSVIAAAKSGKVTVRQEWADHIPTVIGTLAFWENESPDLVRTRQVLERLFMEVGYFNTR
ncbi:hypothetical protein VE02_04598 [Pseudogymnoascus sp. 03VT05]|nr:hypothetical protein VE02_04598 [Pseudogymnoascus sp. 03VT05]